MPTSWFIVENGSEFGPFSLDQLKQLATAKKIRPETLLRAENSSGPISASTIDGVFPPPKPLDATIVEPTPNLVAKIPEAYRPFVALAVVAAGLIFFCCGGCCIVGSFLPAPADSGSFGSKRIFTDQKELRLLLQDKTEDEVIAELGKPDQIFGGGVLDNGMRYQHVWYYNKRFRRLANDQLSNISLYFIDDVVYSAHAQ